MTNKYHSELMSQVKAHAKQLSRSDKEKLERYIGTSKTLYAMGADTQRKIIKEGTKKHPDLTHPSTSNCSALSVKETRSTRSQSQANCSNPSQS